MISVSPYRALDRHWSCWVAAVGVVAIAAVVAAGPGELIGLVGPYVRVFKTLISDIRLKLI